MSKPRSIDRNLVLDMAEKIVTENGPAALTFDAVARAAGITKGGVQSCFGAKSGLVSAMAERWGRNYDECLEKTVGKNIGDISDLEKIHAHVGITAAEKSLNARAACHLAMLVESQELRDWIRGWHNSRVNTLDLANKEDRAARVAYLAAEGAFLLRHFGLLEVSDAQWKSIFSDIDEIIFEKPSNQS